ncbi:MAG TPA: hypothetical protein VI382_05020 [Candidatus Manganitrophaceae bacterium]|nr:hypothetical protein [Candidatus Manganitrophaceae bacterium]
MSETFNLSDWGRVLVVLEPDPGPISTPSKEALGIGRELSDQLGVWLMVYTCGALSDQGKEIVSYGADLIFVDEQKNLPDQTASLVKLVLKERPEILLFPSFRRSEPLAARVAQCFKTGLATDCTALHLDLAERRLLATRPVYDGKLLEEAYWPRTRPQMATLQPGAFPEGFPDPGREGRVEPVC